MAKVLFSSYVTRRKGYVITTRDLNWAKGPDGNFVRVSNGRRGRPAKLRSICVRWTCGQAFTYSWNPALKREATEGMKRSQGQMKEAVAKAKEIWADPVQKAAWQARFKQQPGKYKTAWMMLVGECFGPAQENCPSASIQTSKTESKALYAISLNNHFYRYMKPRTLHSGASASSQIKASDNYFYRYMERRTPHSGASGWPLFYLSRTPRLCHSFCSASIRERSLSASCRRSP